jgi:DNA modification methylase
MTAVRHRRRPEKTAFSLPAAANRADVQAGIDVEEPALAWAQRRALAIEYRAIADLQPAARNPRTHSKKQIRQIAASIRQFGFVNPVLIDAAGAIVAGHGRLAAAKELGLHEVPTIRLNHLSEAEKRAYILADNRLAELAGWDRDLLALELQALTDIDLGFEVEITGFDMAQIDLLIAGSAASGEPDPADQEVVPTGSAVTISGDLWQLGPHRLLCADARDGDAVRRLMASETAQMVFTDPPYNVAIDGHVSGLGKVRHREFAMAAGEMTEAEFTAFLNTVLGNLAAVSADGAIHFVCMDWRHLHELLAAGRAVYSELKNLCVWNKDNGGMGSFYRSKHELVFVFKVGRAPHINTFGLGEGGRYRTNVWDYAGVNTLKPDRQDELAMHPTVKPVALVADAIKDCSKRRGIVLDAFGGSGTTLIAAEKTGRRGFLLEIDPLYVDGTIRRWQTLTGHEARHAETGLTFAQTLAAQAGTMTTTSVVEAGHG